MNDQTLKNQNHPFTASELLEFANLQIAAEVLYGKLTAPAGNTNNLLLNGKVDLSAENLFVGNLHTSRFTKTQADEFIKQGWTVLSHLPNTTSGFSGTLFQKKNGELVLSFRSTEFVEDQIRDSVATNTLEITKVGWAMGQIADMEQWFTSLKRDGLIGKDQKITVTGYSLGGHLATAFHILHIEQIDKTLTFNGAGVGSVGSDRLTDKVELQKVIDTFNIYRNSKDNQKLDYFYKENANSDTYYNIVNDLANSINENLTKILGSENISAYINGLEAEKSRVIQQFTEFTTKPASNESKMKLQQINDALNRLLEIANEYQRIDKITFPDGKEPNVSSMNEVDALRFNYQMGILIAGEKTSTHKLFNMENVVLTNDLDIVDSSPNIYNIKAGTYPSMTAVSQLHYGKEIDVAIENQPLYRGDERWNIVK